MEHNTHAPWHLVQNWHGKLAVVDSRNNGRSVDSGRVCNLPQGKNGRGLAMGRLIATAPELYEALSRLLQAVEHGRGWQDMEPAKERARAAIAKAEGDAP